MARRDDHDFRFCEDPDCPRFPCRIYKEGLQEGHRIGFREGEQVFYPQGFTEGWAAGYSAGAASMAAASSS